MRILMFVLPIGALLAAPTVVGAANWAPNPTGTQKSDMAVAHNPITLVGRLQEGENRNDYILTHLNEPPIPVTRSETVRPNVVERDDLAEARNAYRLEAKGVRLGTLVGQQVRIAGTVVEPAHLPRIGSFEARDMAPPKITESELAVIRVTAVRTVRDACGTGELPAQK